MISCPTCDGTGLHPQRQEPCVHCMVDIKDICLDMPPRYSVVDLAVLEIDRPAKDYPECEAYVISENAMFRSNGTKWEKIRELPTITCENEDDAIFHKMINCGLEDWVRPYQEGDGNIPIGFALDRYVVWHDGPDTWKTGKGKRIPIEDIPGGHLHNILFRSLRPWAVGWATTAIGRLGVLSMDERGTTKAVEDEVRAFLKAVAEDTDLQDWMICEFVPQGPAIMDEADERGMLDKGEDPSVPRYHPDPGNAPLARHADYVPQGTKVQFDARVDDERVQELTRSVVDRLRTGGIVDYLRSQREY